nr:general transcription factor IIE subunit 1-like isoform X2 [Setaria viridis]
MLKKPITNVVNVNCMRFAWIKENELAKLLKMKEKNLILLLQFLEEEKLLKRELIKGTQVKINDAIAEKEDGKFNVFTGSYCCLDYSQVLDVTRYRLNHMKQSIKDKLDCAAMIQEYICCICERSYSALDVVHLISNSGNTFRCENCKGELSAQIGDDSARRESRAKYANMLKRLKEQLKPIELQLHILKNLSVPDFRTVEQWTQTNMVEYVADSSSNNICETKVEIPLPNISAKLDDTESDCLAGVKVLPMWIIQKGMCSQEKDQIKDERRVGLKAKRRDGCSGGEFGASSRRT